MLKASELLEDAVLVVAGMTVESIGFAGAAPLVLLIVAVVRSDGT